MTSPVGSSSSANNLSWLPESLDWEPQVLIDRIDTLTLSDDLDSSDPELFSLKIKEHKIHITFQVLSRILHSNNHNKGRLSSSLITYILTFAKRDPKNAEIAFQVANQSEIRNDAKLTVTIDKINFIALNRWKKLFYHLKKETKGISPFLVIAGIGMIFTGSYSVIQSSAVEDGDVEINQRVLGISQIALGSSMVISPFVKIAMRYFTYS